MVGQVTTNGSYLTDPGATGEESGPKTGDIERLRSRPCLQGEEPYFSKRTKKLDLFSIFDINEKF